MLKIDARQQNILKEMGIHLPWEQKTQIIDDSDNSHQSIRGNSPAASAVEGEKYVVSTRPETQNNPSFARTNIKPKTSLTTHPTQKVTSAQAWPNEIHETELSQELLTQRAQAIAQMSLQELEKAAQQCNACTLCKTRRNTVFSAGMPNAQWMIVGEAPGEQEDKQGEPFVGPAGQLLNRMLQQLALARSPTKNQSPVYITNVLKCRPPHNRNPAPNEIALCQAFLKRQIELIQPQVILIVGRFALQALLNTQEAIGKMRGKVHDYHGIPTIVTYHPAYLLRNPIDKKKAWEDLCLAADAFASISA